ncbi:WD repeat-containing protein 53 [Spea bombifrons]|uniref:WD repeat-containing protein 53 n=1 Tax=Spea bombifrons TaxID=233779 RepID=UPI00234BEE06|nr:WD repeat-containing protein 53 [Spea bombifrons]
MAAKWACGLSNSVLSLAVSKDRIVASGTEGGALTLWSEEGRPIGKLQLNEEDVTGIAFSPLCSSRCYVSHGETLSVLDTRAFKEPVEDFRVNKEEINCISVNEKDSLLAAADDSGTVKVLDLETKKVSRTLQRHTNICSSVVFRPHRPQNLLTCGLDMQVMHWSVQKARPLWITDLQQLARDEEGGENQNAQGQLFNPPLAHSLSVAACGNVFCCGAEDGNIRVFRVTGTQFEEELCFKGHTQGVSQVSFLDQESSESILLSGGNDGRVCLWDIDRESTKQQNQTPTKHRHHRKSGASHSKTRHSAHQATDIVQRLSPKMCIEHGEKINWIIGAELEKSRKVLVADLSCEITVYPLGEL